jgi:membrane protein required for colicin V production
MYDSLILLLLTYAGYKGYQKGFIQTVLSFVGYLIGLWLAVKCSAILAQKLQSQQVWMPFVVFLLILVAVGWLVKIIGRSIRGLLNLVLLGWLDGILGMLIYCFLFSLIISLFIFFLSALQLLNISESQSELIPLLQPLGPGLIGKADEVIPYAKDSFEILKNFFSQPSPKIGA